MNLFGLKLYAPDESGKADPEQPMEEGKELVLNIEGLNDLSDADEKADALTDALELHDLPELSEPEELPDTAVLTDFLSEEEPDAAPAAEAAAPEAAGETVPAAAEVAEAVKAILKQEEQKAAPEPAAQAEAPKAEPAETKVLPALSEPEPAEQKDAAEAPEEAPAAEKLASVSYASVAKAVEDVQKEPTGRFNRDAIDDETLLSELYALIGGPTKPQTEAPEAVKPKPVQKPVARITPETLQALPEEPEELEEDAVGVPGWLKGVFILLISLLLSAMTCYAVASDVIGQIF